MRNFTRGVAVCMLFVFAACATVGKPFDTTHVNDIRKGESDMAQIRAWFGEPHSKVTFAQNDAGCVERWQWTHGKGSAFNAKGEALVIDFDSAGKVCDHAFSTAVQ